METAENNVGFSPHAGTSDVRYDPAIIQAYAKALYARATFIVIAYVAIGLGAGFLVGAIAKGAAGVELLPISVAVGGALVGYALGAQRAFALQLQAQLALCQVTIERNTRRLSRQGRQASTAQ